MAEVLDCDLMRGVKVWGCARNNGEHSSKTCHHSCVIYSIRFL